MVKVRYNFKDPDTASKIGIRIHNDGMITMDRLDLPDFSGLLEIKETAESPDYQFVIPFLIVYDLAAGWTDQFETYPEGLLCVGRKRNKDGLYNVKSVMTFEHEEILSYHPISDYKVEHVNVPEIFWAIKDDSVLKIRDMAVAGEKIV